MRSGSLQVSILAVGFALSGCSSDSGDGGSTGGGGASSGGTAASGGTRTGGGNTSTAGNSAASGGLAVGGTATTIGGVTSVGGTSAVTTSTAGGVTSVGGTSTGTMGGAPLAGGSAAVGGVGATGGTVVLSTCVARPTVPTPTASDKDVATGNLIQFNDNGAWCWYQDERAVVDVNGGKLVIASVANVMGAGGSTEDAGTGATAEDAGTGGASRDGLVEVVTYDLDTGSKQRYGLYQLDPDDHDEAALLVRPDGKYIAMYAGHNQDCNSYYRIFDGTQWGTQGAFDWTPLGCDDSASDAGNYVTRVTYSNLWNMSAENKIYSFVRSIDTSPNMLVSNDNGSTWTYGGRLTATPQTGYVAGYYKYWGNGVDRIDFVGTEAHPRDFNNTLYHGYIKGGQTFDSFDSLLDTDITDTTAPPVTKFTRVFPRSGTLNGVSLSHAWNIDLQRYADGTIALLWQARANWTSSTTPADADPDLRLLYARFDGTTWSVTYLGKAGHKLFAEEQDYTGLGALHPNNPHIIYISTTIDPRDDTTDLGVHEIFEGITCDDGATWQWIPITQKSTADNLRPIVPNWNAKNTALLWWKGTYIKAQQYDAQIVGLITSTQ